MRTQQTGPARHQARLVYAILIIMLIYFCVLGTLNILVFDDYTIAALDYSGAVGVLAVLLYFHRSGRLLIASWLVVLVMIAVLLSFIHVAEGRSYSIIWVTILPPVAFFLLGRSAGAWLSALIFLYVIVYMYLKMPDLPPAEIGMASWLNIVEVLTAQWFLFRLYERSRAEAFAELERLSVTDKLTGLLNRSRLDTVLQQEIERHHRSGQPLTLVMCDIDYFKRINDQHGHLTGDRVLQDIAGLLTGNMRQSDICGRWGGEEFLIVCPDTASEAATVISNKLRTIIAAARLSKQLQLTMSFGIATLLPGETAEQLLHRADDALYQAKRNGRNRLEVALSQIKH